MNKKEILMYLLFGGLTTLINISTFVAVANFLGLDYKIATAIAWLVSVLFAYITNKLFVFQPNQKKHLFTLREILSFFSLRIFSFFLDMITMIILIDFFRFNDLLSKILANILVIMVNYNASKFFIFQKSKI